MSSFYAHVCKNGHTAVDYKRAQAGQTCKECGAEVLDACPSCGQLIKKWHYYGSVVLGPKTFDAPDTCAGCGAEFPWADGAERTD